MNKKIIKKIFEMMQEREIGMEEVIIILILIYYTTLAIR